MTVDVRQRGLMHMQGDDVPSNFNGIATEGEWEAAVPDGTYNVTVSVGDQPGSSTASCPAPCYDSLHSVNVEGVEAIDQFHATADRRVRDRDRRRRPVDDGRLTIDADGGTNTKINFVDVEVADLDAPAAPAGVVATPGDGQNTLEWDANAESDVVGYRVYGSTDENVQLNAANRLSPATPQAARTFTHDHLTNGTVYRYVVTAVDRAGNESIASTTVDATPQDRTAPAPASGAATPPPVTPSSSWRGLPPPPPTSPPTGSTAARPRPCRCSCCRWRR